jgi:hypothetical protein
MGPADEAGPLRHEEATLLEATLLPHLERHHLRLLAHGLRSFQAMVGRCHGELPSARDLENWLAQQPGLEADPGFRDCFRQQLIGLGQQLEQIAAELHCTPLALSLDQLIGWATAQADARLEQQQRHPPQHQ